MIIRYLAKKTTQKCLTEEESEYTKIKIEYGLELLFDTIVKILGLLGMAFILDVEIYFFISVISFCVLRYYAGGIHLRDNWSCFLCTVMICFLPCIIGGACMLFSFMACNITDSVLYIGSAICTMVIG